MNTLDATETPLEGNRSTERRDQEITLAIMHALEEGKHVSQRSLATRAGVALGLVNAYLKRCVNKGLVKIQQIPPGRYRYYLTPKGFAEKSRLTAEFLDSAFDFFRRARHQCGVNMDACLARGWRRIVLYGMGELAEVAILSARERGIQIVAVVDPAHDGERFLDFLVGARLPLQSDYDAVLLTDLSHSGDSAALLAAQVDSDRVFYPDMLHIRLPGANARQVP